MYDDLPKRVRLLELYHGQGLTQSEVGEEFGVSGTTVKRWMDQLGIDTWKPRNEDLLVDLQRVGGGDAPTQSEYNEHGEYGVGTIQRRFDGWNAALQAAGYEPRTDYEPITKNELLTDLKTLAEELGRTPSQQDINEFSDHSHRTYYRKFDGGLREAQRQAGMEPNRQNERNRVMTACDNPDCEKDGEKTPSGVAVSEYDYCSRACHYAHKSKLYRDAGNPQSTLVTVSCESCGASIDRPKWKREQNKRHYCSECWGDSKVPIECEQCGEVEGVWPAVADERRFCSYECVGNWRSENITGESHPRWQGGYGDPFYGPNWHEQRQKAIVRDQARCQACGTSEREYVRRTGEGLSVHHIIPIREFVADGSLDHERANRLGNLVALCRPCHSLRESEKKVEDT